MLEFVLVVVTLSVLAVCLFLAAVAFGLKQQRDLARKRLSASEDQRAGALRLLDEAELLANLCHGLPQWRSSDSFTGTAPTRSWEVAHNSALEEAGERARRFLVSRGRLKPKVIVPDDAFRGLGPSFPDNAPEEIKTWKP